jgi:hypothetical protein
MSDSEQKTERGDAMDDAPSSVNEAHQQQPAAAATTQEPPQSPTKELKDGGYGWFVTHKYPPFAIIPNTYKEFAKEYRTTKSS